MADANVPFWQRATGPLRRQAARFPFERAILMGLAAVVGLYGGIAAGLFATAIRFVQLVVFRGAEVASSLFGNGRVAWLRLFQTRLGAALEVGARSRGRRIAGCADRPPQPGERRPWRGGGDRGGPQARSDQGPGRALEIARRRPRHRIGWKRRTGRPRGPPRRRRRIFALAVSRLAEKRDFDPPRRRSRRGNRRVVPGASRRIAVRAGDRPGGLRRATFRAGGPRLRHGRRHLARAPRRRQRASPGRVVLEASVGDRRLPAPRRGGRAVRAPLHPRDPRRRGAAPPRSAPSGAARRARWVAGRLRGAPGAP